MAQVIEEIGGLQTQYAPTGYVSLWTRMSEFERGSLTRAMEERQVIHGTLMRVTIHSVTARDYWPMAIGTRASRREWMARTIRGLGADIEIAVVADVVRGALADGPVKARELTRRVVEHGYPERAAGWAGMWVDLVRVPPSGTWERRANDLYELAERWLPISEVHPEGEPTEEDGVRLMLQRYLHGFGPARAAEFADWAQIPMRRANVAIKATELRRFRDESGRELIDLPDMPLPPEDTPAPVRFLAQFDPTLLVNCRRTQILPEPLRPIIFNTRVPWPVGTVLVDGQVAATWRHELDAIVTQELVPLGDAQRRDVAAEAERLTAFYRG